MSGMHRDREPNRPFRWDLVRRDRLGTLLPETPRLSERFVDEVLHCAARVVALSEDGDMYFVGRSPDSLFDVLSGLFSATPHLGRLHQLPLSVRWGDADRLTPEDVAQLRTNLSDDGVSPQTLMRRDRPLVFVDLVHEGTTFGLLHAWVRAWIADEQGSWPVIRTKLRYLGITSRTKTSPNTWRWQQHAEWTRELPARAVRNVSLEPFVWSDLGNRQPKITPSFRRALWSDPSVAVPRRDERTLLALAEAVAFVEFGRSPEGRARFRELLQREPAAKERWLRSLLPHLRP
jgi:hypothetical protein